MNRPGACSAETLHRVIRYLVCALIIRVTAAIVVSYRHYLPPNFSSDFLQGREPYFFGSYQYAFYSHLFSGPSSLIVGMLLLNERIRTRWPEWHRILGRIQAVMVLGLVVPSGLGMSVRSDGGIVAATGFAALALATGFCCVQGWRSAVRRRFVAHRCWMARCFVLLSSAVVLRIIGGSVLVLGLNSEWTYPASAWACWLCPLGIFEWAVARNSSGSASTPQPSPRHQSSSEPAGPYRQPDC